MDTIQITNEVKAPENPLVEERRRITTAGIRKITKDLQSKCDMLCRTLNVKDVCTVNYTRSRHSSFRLRYNMYDAVNVALLTNYTKQISDNDASFKDLRESLQDIESKYVQAIKVYNLDYQQDVYRNPFLETAGLLSDKMVADKIVYKTRAVLNDFITDLLDEITVMMNSIPDFITASADRLNRSNNPYERRAARTRRLANIAEERLGQIYSKCEEFKTKVTDEYQKYNREKICPSNQGHEGYGPTAIL